MERGAGSCLALRQAEGNALRHALRGHLGMAVVNSQAALGSEASQRQ